MDHMASVLGISLALSSPSLILKFASLGRQVVSRRYGNHPEQTIQVFNNIIKNSDSNSKGTSRPIVLIFVHGGAWGSGKPWMYRIMAAGFAEKLGASTMILVGYPVYPKFSIAEQVECVFNVIRYVRRNQRDLNIPDNALYVLSGHSSGANICALALFSCVELKVKPIDAFIGLSGVYDVEKHYLFEQSRGVHEISPMGAAALGRKRHWEFSPTKLLKRQPKCETFPELWPKTLLLHGQSDTTVPYSSTYEFSLRLRQDEADVTTAFPSNVSSQVAISIS
jgi:acetyl esterase/lipase